MTTDNKANRFRNHNRQSKKGVATNPADPLAESPFDIPPDSDLDPGENAERLQRLRDLLRS